MNEKEYVKSVFKALDVLETLAKSDKEKGCLEIARELNLPSSTAYRLLNTLELRNYVKQNPITEGYRLGSKILDLQYATSNIVDLKTIAIPFMNNLTKISRESCNLGIIDGNEVLHISRVESPEVLRANIQSLRLPAYNSAIGKVLLAFLSETEIDKLLPDKIPKVTEKTKVSKDELYEEFKVIKKQRYAIDDEEGFVGVRSVAVPVYDNTGGVIAALSLVGPTERMTYKKLDECKCLLMDAAYKISKELGFKGKY